MTTEWRLRVRYGSNTDYFMGVAAANGIRATFASALGVSIHSLYPKLQQIDLSFWQATNQHVWSGTVDGEYYVPVNYGDYYGGAAVSSSNSPSFFNDVV